MQELVKRLEDRGYKGLSGGLTPELQWFVLDQLLQIARDSNIIVEEAGLIKRVIPVQVCARCSPCQGSLVMQLFGGAVSKARDTLT